MVQLDDVDKEILRILKLDSKATMREISRRLDVSPATVSRKIRRMEEDNTIKGYVSIVEDEKLGKRSRAVLLLSTSGDYDLDRVLEKVTEMEDICNVYLTMGNYDIILTACATDEAELYKMIKEMRSAEGVLRVDFASIVSRRKVLNKILPQP